MASTARTRFDENVKVLTAYSDRVAQLSPAAWDRLRLRCADLNGPEFAALVNRALLTAKVHEMWLPESAQRIPFVRAIRGVSRVVQRSLAFTFEIVSEFEQGSPEVPARRTARTGNATMDAYCDAFFLIEATIAPFERTDPGVARAIHAAGQAAMAHDRMPPAEFDAVYGYVEAEIPFAELEAPSNDASA